MVNLTMYGNDSARECMNDFQIQIVIIPIAIITMYNIPCLCVCRLNKSKWNLPSVKDDVPLPSGVSPSRRGFFFNVIFL